MGKLLSRLQRFVTGRSNRANSSPSSPPQIIEPLEQRFFLTAGPRVAGIFADNRGQVVLTMDRGLSPTTVTTKSALIYTTANGRNRKKPATVTYNKKQKQITLTASLPANTAYKIFLSSKLIKGTDGSALDGEFKGAKKLSGNGVAGGDYLVQTKTAAKSYARFSTVMGNIDVLLFNTQTPLTVNNFLRYANNTDPEYSYDNTFFHRSVPNFVIQGGGSKVTADNQLNSILQYAAVPNEPHPNDPGNIRGTIAMAKLGNNANSATNQWFFNLADNRSNLDNQNGGFTVFGKIVGKYSTATMDRIAALPRFNLGNDTPFTETPIVDGDAAIARGELDPAADLVIVRRVAIMMDVVKA